MIPFKPYTIQTSEFQETHKRYANNDLHSILLSTLILLQERTLQSHIRPMPSLMYY